MTTPEFSNKLNELQSNLMSFAFKLTSDKEDAKDLLQETFMKALMYHHKFVIDNNLKAWIYTIMRNTYINDYRRSKLHTKYRCQAKDMFYLNFISAMDSYNPDSVYASIEIESIIETLDDKVKLPFKMHLDGFKYQEIAEELNLNLGTVKSRIFWARKKLMDHLDR